MRAKRNFSYYISATLCKGVRRGKQGGYHGRLDRSSDCYDFCMAHYADDIERMRRNEWRNDEEVS